MKSMKANSIETLALQLATAVKEWAKVDSHVADVGWTKENEWKWDDCRDVMTDLADRVLALAATSAGKQKKGRGETSSK